MTWLRNMDFNPIFPTWCIYHQCKKKMESLSTWFPITSKNLMQNSRRTWYIEKGNLGAKYMKAYEEGERGEKDRAFNSPWMNRKDKSNYVIKSTLKKRLTFTEFRTEISRYSLNIHSWSKYLNSPKLCRNQPTWEGPVHTNLQSIMNLVQISRLSN